MSNVATTAPNGGMAFNFFDPVQFETLQKVCTFFANSDLVPDIYKVSDKVPEHKAVANCMIAFGLAQRMQADPLMVMQNLAIIQGRPSWSSKFLIGTVNTCGRYNELEYEKNNAGKIGKITITTGYAWKLKPGTNNKYKEAIKEVFDGSEIDNLTCVAFTSAKGGTKILRGATISIKMAIEEGWYLKDGSKWVTMPEQMLMYRAASFWTNAYAPELSMGMRTTEEVQDLGNQTEDTTYTDVTDKPAANVQAEINSNANASTLTFDPEPGNHAGPPVADPGAGADNQQPPAAGDGAIQNPVNQSPPVENQQQQGGGDSNPGGLFKATGGPNF